MHSIRLDIRWPIGILFTLHGLVLSSYGALQPQARTATSVAGSANLRWGVVMLVFGLLMLVLAWRHRRRPAAQVAGPAPAAGQDSR